MASSKCYSEDEQIYRTGLVVERFCEIERLIDDVIFDFVGPSIDAEDFVRVNLLDKSVLPFSAKVKLLQVINRNKKALRVNREKFHRLLGIRNAFAHNSVSSNLEVDLPDGAPPEVYFAIESVKGDGAVQKIRRDDAFEEFMSLCEELRGHLTELLAVVRQP